MTIFHPGLFDDIWCGVGVGLVGVSLAWSITPQRMGKCLTRLVNLPQGGGPSDRHAAGMLSSSAILVLLCATNLESN